MKKRKFFKKTGYSLLILLVFLLALLTLRFSGKQPGNQQTKDIKDLPKDYNLESIYSGLKFSCGANDFSCISDILKEVTSSSGPQAAIYILQKLQTEGKIEKGVDDHQLAHHIGRETAATFGTFAKAFLLCPMADYNGGCQHGFFEHVLGKTATAKEAAESICEDIKGKYSSKDYFYCYHGVGHGVMMAQAYDLQGSLNICNSLGSSTGQDGCWQGVFMENVNGGMKGEVRDGIFSDTDPLAPCNSLDKKYQHECFINHAGWLMRFFANNFQKATSSCLGAPQDMISSCLQSIGLMVTNPSWQINFFSDDKLSFEQKAWQLCQQFPKNYTDQCVVGAVDNLVNFDQFNLSRVEKFCEQVDAIFTERCFVQIGIDLSAQATSKDQIKNACLTLKGNGSVQCLKGAGISQ